MSLRELELLRKQAEEHYRILKEIAETVKRVKENNRILKEIPLKQLAETNDQWYAVRQATLDEWSELVADKDLIDTRNNLVPGGSVIADIEVIKNHSFGLSTEIWEKTFEDAYGISFNEIKDEDLPMKVYLALNRRASVTYISSWKNRKDREARREIRELCDEIIQAWRKKEVGFLEEGSKSLAQYERINQLWQMLLLAHTYHRIRGGFVCASFEANTLNA